MITGSINDEDRGRKNDGTRAEFQQTLLTQNTWLNKNTNVYI